MIVYVLLSTSDKYLDAICTALNRNTPEHELVLVQADDVEMVAHGVDHSARDMLVPGVYRSRRLRRVNHLMDYILSEGVAKQHDRYAFIMHCDLIPLVPIVPEVLLEDATVAGPGTVGRLQFPYTWTLIDKERWTGPMETIKERQIYKFWETVVLDGANAPPFLEKEGYDTAMQMEYCAPGFLHARKVSTPGIDEMLSKKVELVNAVVKREAQPSQMPSLMQKLINFEKERRKWFATGRPVRPKRRIEEIFTICNNCDHSIKKNRNKLQCTLCGCYVTKGQRKLSKNTWATTECPADPPKWQQEPNLPDLVKQGCGGCEEQGTDDGSNGNGKAANSSK